MLKDLLKENRSYRGFDENYRFSKEQLEEYVNMTRYTASAVNLQPLKYKIAYKKEETEIVFPLTKWAGALPHLKIPHDGMKPTAFIIICIDTDISDNLSAFQKDVGIAAQTITLAAAEEGLGGCMIGSFSSTDIKEKLSLPDNIEPMLIIALGKPNETIVIKEIENGESTKYYRDENDIHYVPKRKLKDIII